MTGPTPWATLDVSDVGLALQVPGLGTVTVTPDAVTWDAVDGVDRVELEACLGEWAWSQQLLLGGLTVCRGVVVLTGGRAVLVAAPPREGATLTAAALAFGGTPVLADGACPVLTADGAAVAMPGRPALELDTPVAATWPRPDEVTPLPCGRGRAFVHGPAASEPAALTAVVVLSRRGGARGDEGLLDEARAVALLRPCLVPSVARPDRDDAVVAAARAIAAAVPVVHVAAGPLRPPPEVARLVLDALTAVGVPA